MIKLNGFDGNPIYISPENVTAVVVEDCDKTVIRHSGEAHVVDASPEEVVRKIMEYKTAIIRYASDYEDGSAVKQHLILNKLAGLDGDPDAQ